MPAGSANQSLKGAITALNKLNSLANAVEVVSTQIIKTVAATGTPEALATDATYFRSALVIAKKAARTANAGNIYLGIGATNDTQPYEIAPGDVLSIKADPGTKMDLNDWYVDVLNAGDGVAVIYS